MTGKSDDPAWKHEIDELGFAVIPRVFATGEMIALLVSLADLMQHDHRAGIRHVLKHPAIKVIAHDRRLLRIARRVLGDSAFPFRATFFDKSPDSNWLIAWHQDTALPVVEKKPAPGWGPWSVKEGIIYAHAPASALEQVLALRLHLDDSTVDNGPLRVVPETHSRGVLSDDQVARTAAERRSNARWRRAVCWPCGRSSSMRLRNRSQTKAGEYCILNTRGSSTWVTACS